MATFFVSMKVLQEWQKQVRHGLTWDRDMQKDVTLLASNKGLVICPPKNSQRFPHLPPVLKWTEGLLRGLREIKALYFDVVQLEQLGPIVRAVIRLRRSFRGSGNQIHHDTWFVMEDKNLTLFGSVLETWLKRLSLLFWSFLAYRIMLHYSSMSHDDSIWKFFSCKPDYLIFP